MNLADLLDTLEEFPPSLRRFILRTQRFPMRLLVLNTGISARQFWLLRNCLREADAEEVKKLADFFVVTPERMRRALALLPAVLELHRGTLPLVGSSAGAR